MASTAHKNFSYLPKFPKQVAQLRALGSEIRAVAPDFDLSLGSIALRWALHTEKYRHLSQKEFFPDPITLTKTLVDLVGADAETLYAGILNAAIRPDPDAHFDSTYLDQISELFRKDGVVDQRYVSVRDLIVNTLQIRASEIIALPHPITTVREAFDKPKHKEAENLFAYFILSDRNIKRVEDADDNIRRAGGFAIRAAVWYLRLIDMRINKDRYSHQERLNTYYYSHKFYSPFCEYLALQKLRHDPSYSPQAEIKGLYRLKTAIDEELLRQTNPEAYLEIQSQLQQILRKFDIEKGHKPERRNKKLFDLVRLDVENVIHKTLEKVGIPHEYARIEARLKHPLSLYMKVQIGRFRALDHVGFRILVDVKNLQESAKNICGKLHGAFAKQFPEVSGRYKNFYVKPYVPDNGFRGIQNTLIIFGQPIDLHILGINDHIINSIGSASHFFYKLFADKTVLSGKGINTSDMMRMFSEASRKFVVRTDRDFFILNKGATVADLARKIHTDLLPDATGAIISDSDPTNLLHNVHVPLDYPLRNGQYVYVTTNRQEIPAHDLTETNIFAFPKSFPNQSPRPGLPTIGPAAKGPSSIT